VALLFWWESLSPTLMPRTAVLQAAISALCLAIGYAVGTLGARIVYAGLRHWHRLPTATVRRRSRQVLTGVAGVAALVGLGFWLRWQDQQRDLLNMDHLGVASVIPLVILTAILTVILLALGRTVGAAVRHLDRWNRRHLPGPLAQPATVILVVVMAVLVGNHVVFARFTGWADTTFGYADTGTNEGTEQPTSATVSGSPSSLVRWDTLGVQGRDFVAQATTARDLRAFAGADAGVERPVRVYAGLRSAPSAHARAELAVKDLERAGGFDREVLVVATATGTGWIDPDAARALEMVHQGDSAMLSIQYSYLPSWISFITDLDKASEAGAELYTAVHERWSELPADHRPKLVVFGLSLGSFGAEAAFAGTDAQTSVADLVARSDGALFVGAAHANPILQQITAARDVGSPVWAPVFDGGRTVRFVTRDPDQPVVKGPWNEPRVLYIQHPSDPVTYWSPSWLWASPEWMDQPRGYDVPQGGHWFPIVTGVQGVFDLMSGFGAPPGFGHDYRLDYVDGWARIAPPDDWTAADTRRLEAFLQNER